MKRKPVTDQADRLHGVKANLCVICSILTFFVNRQAGTTRVGFAGARRALGRCHHHGKYRVGASPDIQGPGAPPTATGRAGPAPEAATNPRLRPRWLWQDQLGRRLADQVVLPLPLAAGESQFTTERVTQHLVTNAWVMNQFCPGRVRVEGEEGGPGRCWVAPHLR
jgi:hypothetical protein